MRQDAEELILYADNDSHLYRQKDAFLSNMYRKMKSGRYNPELGRKLWMYYVDRAAKQYAKEFGGTWNKLFPRSERLKAASVLESRERRSLESGEYSKYPRLHASDPRRRRRYR